MTGTATRPLSARVAAATPADRDRVVDLVRVACMFVVAFGHWLAAVVTVAADGTVDAASLLAVAPATQWLTLALQVMGLFFAVSGFSSAASLSRRDVDPVRWLYGRLARVLAPTAVYVACWAVLAPLLAVTLPATAARPATAVVAVQLWFFAVIVLLFAATPWLWQAWNRHRWVTVTAAAGGALAVDVAHRVLHVPLVGWANFALVWAVPTLLGFAWYEGRLQRWRWWLLGGGTAAVAALVATPWLPLSMVGVDGAAQSNNAPPSTALVALSAVHVGAVLVAAPALRRWLARPRPWTAVVLAGRVAMTTYLWHLTALVAAVGLLMLAGGTGFTGPVGTASWWLWRPAWLALLALLAVPLVRLAMPAEAAATRASSGRCRVGWVRVSCATVCACAGAALLALDGFIPVSGWALPGGVNGGAALLVGGALAVGAWPVRRADGLQHAVTVPAGVPATAGNPPGAETGR